MHFWLTQAEIARGAAATSTLIFMARTVFAASAIAAAMVALPVGLANAAQTSEARTVPTDASAIHERTLPARGPTFRRMDFLSRREVAITLPTDSTVIRYEFRTRLANEQDYGSWTRFSHPALKVTVNLAIGTWIQIRALRQVGYSSTSTGIAQVERSQQSRGDVTGNCLLPVVRAIIFHTTTMRASVSISPVVGNHCVRQRMATVDDQYGPWQLVANRTRRLTTGTMYEAVPGAVQLRARGASAVVTVMFPGTGPI